MDYSRSRLLRLVALMTAAPAEAAEARAAAEALELAAPLARVATAVWAGAVVYVLGGG